MTDNKLSDEIDLGGLALTLWKGKLIIGLCAGLALTWAAFYVANTRPTFQSDALLQLEERSGGALALPSALSDLAGDTPRSTTEMEVLRSRMVLGQVVADLNLDWVVAPRLAPLVGVMLSRYALPLPDAGVLRPYARLGDVVELDHLSVPPAWINRGLLLEVGAAGAYRVTTPRGEVLDGRVGETLSRPDLGLALNVARLEAPAGRQVTILQRDELSAILALRRSVSASERGSTSGILEVRYAGANPAANTRILNAILQAYQRQNVSRSAAEAESGLRFINEQLPLAEANLREAEAALNAYRQAQVSVDLTFETQAILQQISTTEGNLDALARQEDDIRQRYTPSHPTYRQLLDDRARLEERLAELRGQASALPETQREILNLTRNVELTQGIYTQLLSRAQEVEVLRASTIGNVRIIDLAAAGPGKVAPRTSLVLALGLVLGLVAGATIVLVRGWLKKGVQDAAELERLGLPVFATINYTRHVDTGSRRGGAHPILALSDPTDLAVEAFRSLRTSLHFGMLDAATPTLSISSSHPGAGKSFCAVNLAVIAAQAGHRVCLIDADMRRGQLRRHFDVERHHPGLAEVLAGDVTLAAALVKGPVEGLSFLSSGRYPPNPSELLMRRELTQLVADCAADFDLTLFDCPPVLAVTDPVIVARAVGATILIARHDMTPEGEIEAAIKTFAAAGTRIAGAVLNGFDPRKARAGYGYGYGYGYRYDYKKREN